MIARFVLLALVAMAQVAVAQIPAVCPWLSIGTATNVLGGSPTVTNHLVGNSEGSCRFSRQSDGITETIEVIVGKTNTHPCPDRSTKLAALGNEAMQCRLEGKLADVIAGRMRDVYFVISLTNVPDAVAEPPANTRPEAPYAATLLERIAEQVVGNLY